MSGDRFEVSVTFDPASGYFATAPELRAPVTALSLGGMRRRSRPRCCPRTRHQLALDRAARLERDQRRQGGEARPTDYARPR